MQNIDLMGGIRDIIRLPLIQLLQILVYPAWLVGNSYVPVRFRFFINSEVRL